RLGILFLLFSFFISQFILEVSVTFSFVFLILHWSPSLPFFSLTAFSSIDNNHQGDEHSRNLKIRQRVTMAALYGSGKTETHNRSSGTRMSLSFLLVDM